MAASHWKAMVCLLFSDAYNLEVTAQPIRLAAVASKYQLAVEVCTSFRETEAVFERHMV